MGFGRSQCGRTGFGEIRFWQNGCGAGGDDAVATGALGLVESVVGELEEEIDANRGAAKHHAHGTPGLFSPWASLQVSATGNYSDGSR